MTRSATTITSKWTETAAIFSNLLPFCLWNYLILHFYCRLRFEMRFLGGLGGMCGYFPQVYCSVNFHFSLYFSRRFLDSYSAKRENKSNLSNFKLSFRFKNLNVIYVLSQPRKKMLVCIFFPVTLFVQLFMRFLCILDVINFASLTKK